MNTTLQIGIEHLGTLPVSALPRDGAFMAFLHPKGQMLFTVGAECIKSPDNPYYKKSKAEEKFLDSVYFGRRLPSRPRDVSHRAQPRARCDAQRHKRKRTWKDAVAG